MRIDRQAYARLTGRLYELHEARSLKKGDYSLSGGGSILVSPSKLHKGKMLIQIWPKSHASESPPGHAEDAELLKQAAHKLDLTLRWSGEWTRHKYAGYYRMAEPAERVVQGRSREIGKWLDKTIVDEIDRVYQAYENGALHKEPMLSVGSVLNLLGGGPGDWSSMSRKARMSRVQAAVKRLAKKRKLVSSIGVGHGGREAQVYEPYWFAKKHGNA